MILPGKRVLLGVCGGIAAYKAPALLRLLQKKGAKVKVVLTSGAEAFITPLTFEALSGERAFCQRDFLRPLSGLIPHVELGRFAEAILVAPATASFLASLAAGDAESLLSATIMASEARVLLCPAMNPRMWAHPAVQENVAKLRSWGYEVLSPGEGELACGEVGPGRLPPEEVIVAFLERLLGPQDFSGKKVLVTAGPTREPLDLVRFLSNRSSGRMGLALAVVAWLRGAQVTLIHGPLAVSPPPFIATVSVETAQEMREAVLSRFEGADVLIMAAAVSDYRPKEVFPGKIKKTEKTFTLTLERTPDILTELSRRRRKGQILVGFAAEEGENLIPEAERKLEAKGLDLIVANDISRKDTGFEVETNEVFLIGRGGLRGKLPLAPKDEIAWQILDAVKELLDGEAGRPS